jgi:hypothetical protein
MTKKVTNWKVELPRHNTFEQMEEALLGGRIVKGERVYNNEDGHAHLVMTVEKRVKA